MNRAAPHPTALIVDDEADIRELIAMTMERMGIQSSEAQDLQHAYALLQQQPFDLCLTDMRLPDGNGLELIRHISTHYPATPVAMITAHGNMDSAIDALKAGAFDFVNKPVELKTLKELISSALQLRRIESSPPLTTAPTHLQLLGTTEVIQQLHRTIQKLARSQAPVYISGESGTGKELVARLIHHHGSRSEAPFVAVNCGAIPAELIESELFGHMKGSFTGAHSNKEGLFQAANGGTLFLDEVADLPLGMQVKLLRAIQEKAIRPIGASGEHHVDVRILSATHKELAAKVRAGEFREDLYFRINVIELAIPSLRDHPEDIPLLVAHISDKISRSMGQPPPQLSAAAIQRLAAHPFPGNVRELENILERAMTLCEGPQIGPDELMLPAALHVGSQKPMRKPVSQGASPMLSSFSAAAQMGLEGYMEQIEREILTQALEQHRFNKTAAAKSLGVSFRSFRYRLKRLGIE